MATAKPPALPPVVRATRPTLLRPGRCPKWRSVLALSLIGAALVLAWFWKPLNGYAVAGASYGAKITCSCRYLGGRSLADCRKDFVPGMTPVTFSEDAKTKSITARFPLLSRQTAQYREGEGCVLEKWQD